MNDDLLKKAEKAIETARERTKPFVDDAIKKAESFRDTIADKAQETAGVTNHQTAKALDEFETSVKSAASRLWNKLKG